MWEVFTCGKMPYGRMKNSEVVDRVQKGNILEKPKGCDKEIYDVSKDNHVFFMFACITFFNKILHLQKF